MKNILAFGDSNTWGLIPGTKKRYPWGVRWTSRVQDRLSDSRVIEEGLCGRTTVFEDGLRPLRKAIDALPMILESVSPIDMAVIMLGTNDCKAVFNASAHTITMGLEACLSEVDRYIPPERVLIISPISLGKDVWREDKDPEFNSTSIETSIQLKEYYRNLAKKKGYLFLAASDYARASDVDDEHLDVDGHRELALAVADKLEAAL